MAGNNEVFAAVETEADAISAPMVFFCLKCQVIVGDSYSLLKINADMNTMTLTGASNVSRSADVYTSKSGPDVGSTYFRFNCSSCQAALGRYYLTTSKDLDDLREKFTFTVDSLGSYELGKAQHGKAPDLVAESVFDGTESTGAVEGGVRIDEGEDIDRGALKEDITKIQHVVMELIERVARQEQTTQRITQHLAMLVSTGAPQVSLPQPREMNSGISNDSNNGFPQHSSSSSQSNKRSRS